MITVTDNAVKHLQALLADHADPAADGGTAAAGLRLAVETGGCSGLQYGMSIDRPKDGDLVVQREGVRVLVDAKSAAHLRGSVIDYCDDLTGTGFRIQNPNARRTCGCGTSFEPAAEAAAGGVS